MVEGGHLTAAKSFYAQKMLMTSTNRHGFIEIHVKLNFIDPEKKFGTNLSVPSLPLFKRLSLNITIYNKKLIARILKHA